MEAGMAKLFASEITREIALNTVGTRRRRPEAHCRPGRDDALAADQRGVGAAAEPLGLCVRGSGLVDTEGAGTGQVAPRAHTDCGRRQLTYIGGLYRLPI
jgi:hypothetical protein